MKIKLSIFLLTLVFLAITSPVHGLLTDGAAVGIPPNGVYRVTVELPDDFGVVGGVTEFVVKTNCDEWCDLHYAKVITDPQNPVRVPLYISAKDKQLGDKKSFKIDIGALGLTNTYSYGVCVTSSANTNKGSGDPCAAVNSQNDAFSLSISPEDIYTQPNKQVDYNISVYSQEILEIDVKSSTGNTWTVTTNPNNRTALQDKYTAGANPEQITVEATIKNCKNSAFCKKTAAANVIPSTSPPTQAGGDFVIKIDPARISAKKGLSISYSLDITNYKQEKLYDIEIILPEGLESDFKPIKGKPIPGKDSVNFRVTPTGDQSSYTFQMKVVSSENITKLTDATINMNELVTDAGNAASTAGLDPETVRRLNEFRTKHKDSDLGTQIAAADDVNKPVTSPRPTRSPTATAQPQGLSGSQLFDLLLIIVPAVVVILALVVLLIRKKKPAKDDEEEGEYRY